MFFKEKGVRVTITSNFCPMSLDVKMLKGSIKEENQYFLLTKPNLFTKKKVIARFSLLIP